MLRHAAHAEQEAQVIEDAVAAVCARRCCTPDLADALGVAPASGSEVAAAIIAHIAAGT